MGQAASKAAGRVAKSAASGAAKTAATTPPPSAVGGTSGTAAAAAASAQVRPPSFDTRPSQHDLAQQQFLKQQGNKGNSGNKNDNDNDYTEMPSDLLNFLKDAGPLDKQDAGSTAGVAATRPPALMKEPRLPKQPWQQSQSSSGPIQEKMPLAEKIEGFETTKTTSFSRHQEEINPKFYQKGTTLDMYRLLSRRQQNSTSSLSSSSAKNLVEETYREYAAEFPLPAKEDDQAKQKELLSHTLQYLELPVIMKDRKDNEDAYDGIFPQQVDDYKMLRMVECPKTQVRLVLEDLWELENEEKPPSSS